MKKLIYLIVFALILGLVLTGCSLLSNISQVPATTDQSGVTYLTKGDPTSFPLYAGQRDLVGKVLVWDDGEELCVRYELNEDALEEGWLIYETHVDAATTLGGIPQKNGNPPPGKLRYGDDELPGVAVAGPYCIPFEDIIGFNEGDDLCGVELVIAAHAVIKHYTVTCDDPVVLLATENNHPTDIEMEARIWSITQSGTANMVSNIIAQVQPNTDNFNGNAYDDVNNRFYFSDYPNLGNGISPLYFNDLQGTQTYAGDLTGAASGGTFYNGAYYYIAERTDNLRVVTFGMSGEVLSDNWLADIFPGIAKVLAFGDIDIQDDVIYGSATELPGGVVFFSMNLDGTEYQVIATGTLYGAGGTQIAFGSDGVLYGVNARTPFELFSIDTANGDTMFIAKLTNAFSDLASGPVCVPQYETETAWGAEDEGLQPFPGKNWATYFSYTVQPT